MSRVRRGPPRLPSPVRIFPALLAIFLAEALILYLVPHFLPHPHSLTGALLIAALLVLCITPPLWWLLIRPLQSTALVEYSRGATVVAHAVDGIITIDQEGQVEAFNPAAERIFCYRAEEVIGRPVTLLMPERYREAHQRGLQRVRSGGESRIIGKTVELTGLRKDGREFPLELSLMTWQARDRTFYTGIVRDITERKQADQQLCLQSTAMESAANAIVITDRGGRITWVNSAFTRLTGYTAEEVLGRNPRLLKSGNHDQAFYENLWETILSGRVWQQEMTNRRKDGSLITEEQTITPVRDERGEITHFVSIHHDITDRMRSEAELQGRARQQAAVATLGQRALAGAGLAALMDEAVVLVAQTLAVEFCKVLELMPGGAALRLRAGVGWHDGLVGHATVGSGIDSQAGYTLTSREPVIVEDLLTETRFSGPQVLHDHGVVSGLSVIIPAGERPFGVLGAHSTRRRAFTQDDVNFLQAVANVLATATERRRMEEAVRVRTQQLEAVRAVTTEITRELNLMALLSLIVRRAAELVGATSGVIFLWDETAEALLPKAWHGSEEWFDKIPRRPGDGVAGWVAMRRTGLLVNNYQSSPYALSLARGRTDITAALGEPLLYQDRLLGVIGLAHKGADRSFTDQDRETLVLFAANAAIAIENARLFAATEQRAAELQTLRSIDQAITGRLELSAVLEAVVAGAMELLGTQHTQITLWDEATQTLRFGAALGTEAERVRTQRYELGKGISGTVAHTRQPMILDDYQASPYALPEFPGVIATLSVPILFEDRLMGVLHSHTTTPGKRFTGDDHHRLQTLASQAAIAIENARLYTELRQSYQDLHQAQGELVRTEKLRALGQMAAGIAHDLNNMLAAILGQVELLRLQVPEPVVQQALALLTTATTDGAEVVRRLQGFGRQEPLVPCDLPTLVAEAVDLTRPRWKDDPQRQGHVITVQTVLQSLPPILGNPAELREALLNLILNAVDAMPQGGTLTLAGQVTPAGVEIAVTDTGVGMSEVIRQRIFDPFFTTKAEKGTGLGLSMVYGILERHGGHISVDSTPGKGSTFTLRFPPAPGTLPPPAVPPHLGPPRRLLLIDDDPLVRQTLARLLRTAGHTVLEAAGGPAGLACLAAEPVDLVLTDLGMPDMNGIEVARAVKTQAPHLPVLLLTGWGDQGAPEVIRTGLVNRVLGKPFRLQEVLDTIAEHCGTKPATPGIEPKKGE